MLIESLFWIYRILSKGIEIYSILLILYFLMSWMPGAAQSKLGYYLMRICEPYVGFFRRFIPSIGMISLAGMVAYFSLTLIQRGLTSVFQVLIRLLA